MREPDSERRARLERRCLEAAARQGFRGRFVEGSDGPSDWRAGIVDGVRSAISDGAGLVIAVGGDGTVGAAAQGVGDTGATFAVVPRGAANLFARALKIPFGFEAALAVAFDGSTRPVDLAFVNGRAVATMAGIGVDAAVVAATTAASKHAVGWVGYGLATLPHLLDHQHRFELRLDDGPAMTVRAQSVVVANLGVFPGGLVLSPRSRPDDGRLDVTALAPHGLFGWAAVFWGMVQAGHRHVVDGRLLTRQAGAVAITADVELPRQLDGEPVAASRELAVRIRQRALSVRVPRS